VDCPLFKKVSSTDPLGYSHSQPGHKLDALSSPAFGSFRVFHKLNWLMRQTPLIFLSPPPFAADCWAVIPAPWGAVPVFVANRLN